MDLTRRGMMLGAATLPLMASRAGATEALGGHAFGSTWRLVLGQPGRNGTVVAEHVARITAAMSPYLAASQLSRFNRALPGKAVAIPPDMVQVARAAFAISRASGGAFDPTTGPLVHRFGFGPITGGPGSIDAVDFTGTTLCKTAPGVTLDFCGIAKGHALDVIANALVAEGARDFVLEIGGEVRAMGRHPSGRDWRVAIEDPISPTLRAAHVVVPGALALATSGHVANGLSGPVALSHVIDPATARPATGFAASVSVLAETGMAADAWATALLAMGPRGPEFARTRGILALFVLMPEAGGASLTTGDFAHHLLTPPMEDPDP